MSVTLSGATLDGSGQDSCTTTLTVKADGTVVWSHPDGGTIQLSAGTDWLPAGSTADFEVFAAVVAGSLGGGTVNTWLSLTSDRSWFIGISGANVGTSVTLRLSLRYNGGDIIAQADYALSAFAYTI